MRDIEQIEKIQNDVKINIIMKSEIINLIFKNPLPTPQELENKYPPRNLPKGALVTRQGPSRQALVNSGLS